MRSGRRSMKKAFWHNPIKSKTMKKQILFALLLLASISLSAQEGFKIAGRLGGTLGGKLLLVTIGSEGAVKLDETTMTNGSFDFAGKVDAVTPAYILTEERQPIASLMLENTEFAVVAGQEGIEVEGGGDAQKIWNQYETISQLVSKEKMKMEQEAQTAYSSGNQMKLQAVQQQYLKVAEEAGRQQAALFEAYKDSPVTAFMIFTVMQQADYAYLKELYDGLGETAKNCISGQLIAQRIEQFKQVEVGGVAPDFIGLTDKRDTVSLYGLQAKVKLVDFWASWCGPCRAEMPNVKKVYKKYHGKGLEILGVSIDQKAEDWLKALETDRLPWVNILDQESRIAAYFLVQAIPHTILLDENNKIIAKNLRGKELEAKIAEVLGE